MLTWLEGVGDCQPAPYFVHVSCRRYSVGSVAGVGVDDSSHLHITNGISERIRRHVIGHREHGLIGKSLDVDGT